MVENDTEVNKLAEELSENVKVLRLQLAKRNRTVAALRRQIDDVPNRPELAQYQRRFLELYNQGFFQFFNNQKLICCNFSICKTQRN